MTDQTNDGPYITHQALVNQFAQITSSGQALITGSNPKKISTTHIYCTGDAIIQGAFPVVIKALNGITLQQGSISNPSLNFAGDSSTGIYSNGPGEISFSTNGINSMNATSTAIVINQPITTTSGDLVLNPAGGNINFSGKTLINAGGVTVHVGSPNQVIINDSSGNLSAETHLATTRGGTNLDTSSSTGVAQINAGVWSVSPLSHNIITVTNSNPAVGQFTSIAAAIASISSASAFNPYLISVQPGVYIESAMTVPSWVRIVGQGGGTTTILPNSSSITLFTMQSNSALNDLAIQGMGGTGIGISYDSVLNTTLMDIAIGNFPTPIYAKATSAILNVIFNNLFITPPFINGIVLDGTNLTSSFAMSVLIFASLINGDGSSVTGILCEGPHVTLNLTTCRIAGLSAGTALQLQDGVQFISQGSQVSVCNNGVVIADVGAGPSVDFANITVLNCTTTGVNIAHPGTTGVLSCMVDRTQLIINPSSTIAVFFTDPVRSATGIVGDLLYSRFTGGALTEHGDLLSDCSSLGTYTGGVLSVGTGLQVNVASGVGYVTNAQSYPTQQLLKLSWSSSSLTLMASSINYIYISNGGVLSASGSLTDTTSTLVLGRVGTTGSGIEFIDPQEFSNYHPVNENLIALRNILGARVTAGCIVTASGLQLNISTGTYYFNNNPIVTLGGAPATFYAYYHNSLTTFTRTSQSSVDNVNYDGGTGLISIPAGQYIKHSIYTVGLGANEQYFLVYGQATFASSTLAATGALPSPPNYFLEGIVILASIIVQQGNATIVSVIDQRPVINGPIGSVNGAIYHSSLLGLLADDHTQYLLVNGTRAMTGNFNMGSNNIVTAGLYNGVTVEAHASRHLPNGADAITSAAPLTTLTTTTTNTVGTANSFARSDHTHAIDQTTFSLNSIGGAPLNIANGGTGAITLTSGNFLQGNGASAISALKVIPSGVVVGTTDIQNLTNKSLIDNSTNIVGSSDNTKIVQFLNTNMTSGVNLTIESLSTTSQILQLPNLISTDVVVTAALAQSLTNKTMTSTTNNITASSLFSSSTTINVSSATAPTNGQILTATSGTVAIWQTPTTTVNLNDSSSYVFNNIDNTKRQNWNLIGASSGTETTLVFNQTANRQITFPNITGTLVIGSTTSVNGDLVSYNGTTGIIQDSTIASSNVALLNGNQTFSGINQFTSSPYVGSSANNITYSSSNIVFTQATVNTLTLNAATNANGILTLPNATGTLITGSTSVTSDNLVSYNGTTGVIQDSGVPSSWFNQSVTSSSSPSFVTISTSGTTMSLLNSYVGINTGTANVLSASPVTIITLPIASNHAALIESRAIVFNSTDNTSGIFKLSSRVTNLSGTVTNNGNLENLNNVDSTGFSTSSLTHTSSGGNILVQYGGNASKTHIVKITTWVYYE